MAKWYQAECRDLDTQLQPRILAGRSGICRKVPVCSNRKLASDCVTLFLVLFRPPLSLSLYLSQMSTDEHILKKRENKVTSYPNSISPREELRDYSETTIKDDRDIRTKSPP